MPEAVCRTWPAAPPGTLPGAFLPQEEFPSTWASKPPRVRPSHAGVQSLRTEESTVPSLEEGNVPNPHPPYALAAWKAAEPCDPGLGCGACLSQRDGGLSYCPRKRGWPDIHSELLKG